MRIARLWAPLFLLGLLVGCGQKGPLVQPDAPKHKRAFPGTRGTSAPAATPPAATPPAPSPPATTAPSPPAGTAAPAVTPSGGASEDAPTKP